MLYLDYDTFETKNKIYFKARSIIIGHYGKEKPLDTLLDITDEMDDLKKDCYEDGGRINYCTDIPAYVLTARYPVKSIHEPYEWQVLYCTSDINKAKEIKKELEDKSQNEGSTWAKPLYGFYQCRSWDTMYWLDHIQIDIVDIVKI